VKIWVDADACPVVIKEILYRAAARAQVMTTLVANQPLRTPPSPYLRTIQVQAGFDVADKTIVQALSAGDLVITADIPLAAEVIQNKAHALNPRGTFYAQENIQEHLSRRNIAQDLRASGVETTGPSTLNASNRKAFASQLERFLAKSNSEIHPTQLTGNRS